MFLNELRIDDFGCFRNARLGNLDNSLVVIGGPQRAGKTTFMQALRQFPDGVDRADGLPPATDEYRIDAELTHEGQRYRYVLIGHARPSVSPIGDGPDIDAEDIFGPVTERQYRNLYTISLDELRRLPPGIDDSEDLARVLLGGAYGDIAEIPEIEEGFSDRAYDIGLSRGDPSTKSSELNDPYQTIREGIESRKEASQQVNEYRSVTQELEVKRAEQNEIENEIAHRQQIRNRLNVLKELFDPIQRLETLNARFEDIDLDAMDELPVHLADRLDHFEEQFETATTDVDQARREFDQMATTDTTDQYYEWLLEHESEIHSFTEEQKLWARTTEKLTESKEALEEKRRDIEHEISSLHSVWGKSLTHIDEIETNTVDTARVADLSSTIEELQKQRADLETSIDSAQTRKQELESQLKGMEEEQEKTRKVSVPKQKPAIIAGVAIVVGTGVGFATTALVGGVAGLVALAVGFYAVDSTVSVEMTVDADPYRELKAQVATIEGDIQTDLKQRTKLDAEISEKQQELTEVVTKLGIPEALPPTEVPAFYEHIVELDGEITAYREEMDKWEEEKNRFATEFQTVATLLEDVTDVSWTADKPLKAADHVLDTLETIATDLELARSIRRAERERTERIEDIDSVLTKWNEERSIDSDTEDEVILKHIQAFTDEVERVSELQKKVEERDQFKTQVTTRLESPSAREVFEPLREEDESWTDVLRSAAREYADSDAIADEIRKHNTQIEELKNERDEAREVCIELEQQLDDLASEDDLREARAKIEEGRVDFERLGDAYAVNRIAEAMVNQLHDRLMEDVVHSLVGDASDIFSEITQEYDGIELDGNVQDLTFRAIREEHPDHGIGELSRATTEQLFLAVRLARIRQTDVSLPVVLDDAATNFDPNHMSRVFEVIDQLTESNQVFFLTCHPQCVRITECKDISAQYWSLDGGQFNRRETANTLEQQLSVE